MAMTAQQAEEYLRNNPNAKIRSNNTGQVFGGEQPQPQKKGLLGLIDTILPVRKLSGQALDVGGFLGQNIAQGVGRSVFGDDFGGVQQVTGYDPEDWVEFQRRGGFTGTLGAGLNADLSAFDLLNEQERQRLEKAPILEGIKSGAQIASFAVPTLGTGLGGAIKTGAVAGGLGGFGASESINPVEALGQGATGAVTGGAVSGAVYGIGSLLNKVKPKQIKYGDYDELSKLEKTRVNKYRDTLLGGSKYEGSIKDTNRDVMNLLSSADELGIKADPANIPKIQDGLNAKVEKILSQSDDVIKTDSILDDILNKIDDKIPTKQLGIAEDQLGIYENILSKYGDDLTPLQAHQLKLELQAQFKPNMWSGQQLATRSQVDKIVRDAIDDKIVNIGGINNSMVDDVLNKAGIPVRSKEAMNYKSVVKALDDELGLRGMNELQYARVGAQRPYNLENTLQEVIVKRGYEDVGEAGINRLQQIKATSPEIAGMIDMNIRTLEAEKSALGKVVEGSLKSEAVGKQAKDYLMKMSSIHNLEPAIYSRFAKGGEAGVPALGVIKAPIGLQRGADTTTRRLVDILGGSGVSEGLAGKAQARGSFLQNLASNPRVSSGIGALLAQPGQQTDFGASQAQGMQATQGYQGGVDYNQVLAQVTLNLVDSGYSVAEASKLAEMLLASEGLSPSIDTVDNVPSTEAGRKAYSILQVIDEIEGIVQGTPDVAGYGGGIGGGISQLLNIATPTTAYRNKVESANNLIRNLISGQNVTEPEKVNLQKTLIKVTDSPGIVEQKISTLRTLLSGYML